MQCRKSFVGFNLSEENELAVAQENNCCIYPLNCAPTETLITHAHTQTPDIQLTNG